MRFRAPIGAACAALVIALAVPARVADGQWHQHYAMTQEAQQPAPSGQLAPRLYNLGSHTFPVTTTSVQTQAFVNQGMNLAYGFNHAEAGRAFAEAARLDPKCAMAYWGQSLVMGPNINAAMDPKEEPRAFELLQKAVALKSKVSVREQAYIDALAERYSGRPNERAQRDQAYASAMRGVVRRFPDDLDAASLYAEALMDLRPWGYWTPDGRPYEGTLEAIDLIESVMKRNPNHPGALHFYIHLIEPTSNPDRAVPAADRLLTLMPAAGHMVHMPSHIYQRVGRYGDAVRSNALAARADEDYITQCRAQGLYPMGYYPHNIHFLWWAATMNGQSELALESARKVASKIPDDVLKQMPMLAGFRVVPYYALTRFAKWDEMLNEPAPPEGNPYLEGMWHYARGMAFAATGQLDEAGGELEEVRRISADPALDAPMFSPNRMATVFAIAPEALAGEIALAKKDYHEAVDRYERAVRLNDGLAYTEPAEWHFPPRQALAAVLLKAGRASEAETVYWEDLKRNPENGWALRGLMDALMAQGKQDQARLVEKRFKAAWSSADEVALMASRRP